MDKYTLLDALGVKLINEEITIDTYDKMVERILEIENPKKDEKIDYSSILYNKIAKVEKKFVKDFKTTGSIKQAGINLVDEMENTKKDKKIDYSSILHDKLIKAKKRLVKDFRSIPDKNNSKTGIKWVDETIQESEFIDKYISEHLREDMDEIKANYAKEKERVKRNYTSTVNQKIKPGIEREVKPRLALAAKNWKKIKSNASKEGKEIKARAKALGGPSKLRRESKLDEMEAINELSIGPSIKATAKNLRGQKYFLDNLKKINTILIQNPRIKPERLSRLKSARERIKKALMKFQQSLIK